METLVGLIGTIMTNFFMRAIEIGAAPFIIWWNTKGNRKNFPWPVMMGLLIVVLAASVFLSEKLTAAIKSWTYSEERVVRDWLDSQKFQSTKIVNNGEVFRFDVRVGENTFSIFEKNDLPGVITVSNAISLKPEMRERVKQLTVGQRQILWNEIRMELGRHNLFVPQVSSGDPIQTIQAIHVFHNFTFDESSHRGVLYAQINQFMGTKAVIDSVYESWQARGAL